MPTAKEDVDKGRQLVADARAKDRCLTEAKAVEDAIRALQDSTEITFREYLSFAGLGVAVIGAILATLSGPGAVGGVVGIIGAGTAALSIIAGILDRIQKAKAALEAAIAALEACLAAP
jgi:hypothetical protein